MDLEEVKEDDLCKNVRFKFDNNKKVLFKLTEHEENMKHFFPIMIYRTLYFLLPQ